MNVGVFNSLGELNAVIETPKGSRNKYKYDEASGLFRLQKLLPLGTIFPFDFGFLPSTRAPDGDPLDVLVLMEEPVSVGCLVPVRLIGVLEARQTQGGKSTRNDRLLGIANTSRQYHNVRSIRDLDSDLLAQIELFFVAYNRLQGRRFKALGRHGVSRALKGIRAAEVAFAKHLKQGC